VLDLSTRYLGLRLASPLVASASPLCESLDTPRAMEDAGAAAVVLPSLFEEQIDLESHHLDRYLSQGESYMKVLSSYARRTSFD
jgi:dihydroorotate dehydrogenase (fumarate)